ncbi:hypothetical protein Aam_072_004 [Acidocella aminolytica 101 = DSM 11237]|uniref:Uncharacterized protein n=1 Tax=Acidocella aminolytica 101 = DSM 11237 TaxID=1120923 RepID=A0A0D6PJS1_9PROT|nr:hypothetical protein Aam_072_004 [Acidocella aminolytica 101 = DSM 11237]
MRTFEILADERGTDCLTILPYERTIGLPGQHGLHSTGKNAGQNKTYKEGEKHDQGKGRAEFAEDHFLRPLREDVE